MVTANKPIRPKSAILPFLALWGLALLLPGQAKAVTTVEIAAVNYTIQNGGPKNVFGSPVTVGIVNSTITFEVIALKYSTTKITGVTAVPTGSDVILSHASLAPTMTYVIFDGLRVWEKMSDGAAQITLTNLDLKTNLSPPPGCSTPYDIDIIDYQTLDYTNFTIVLGDLATLELTGASVFVDMGSLVSGIALDDSLPNSCAETGDLASDDGMYHAKISVQRSDDWFVLNALISATVIDTAGSGSPAANSPFISPRPISIDAIPPTITLLNSVPSLFYIAPEAPFANPSQTTSNNNPENERTELHFSLLDKSAAVTMLVLDSGGSAVFNFPIQTLDPGDHLFLWDGRDNLGFFQPHGKYSFTVTATDDVGNTALVQTGQVQITGLFVTVKNLTMSPNPAPSDNGTGQNFTITTISFDVEMTGASQLELAEFGLDSALLPPNPDRPHMLVKPHLFDSAGNLIQIFGPDMSPGDNDSDFILRKTSNVPISCQLPVTFFGRNFDWDTAPTGLSGVYTVGDGDAGNDWDTLMSNFYDTSPDTPPNDVLDVYTGNFSFDWIGNQIEPGTYIVEVQAELAGESIAAIGEAFDKPECDNPDTNHLAQKYHAFPDPKGVKSRKVQSFIFVEEDSTVTGDQVPPQVVAVSPANGSSVVSGFITVTNPAWVIIEDLDSGPSATKTFLELKGPDGAVVPGSVANDGGVGDAMKFYYLPANPVTIGGVYTISVIPVDKSNNVGSVQTFTFVVQDSSVPVVQDVSVTSLGVPKSIYPINTSPLAGASEIRAILYPPLGGAAVDFAKSTISLTDDQGSSAAIYSGTMTSDPTSNSLVYTLDSLLLTDGKHRVTVEAFSTNGSSAIYTFDFTIVSNLDYIDYPPASGYSVSETCMYFRFSDLTVTDSGGAPVLLATMAASDPGSGVISALGFSGDLPAGSVFFGRAIQFVEAEMNFSTFVGQLPVIRLHFDENDVIARPLPFDMTQDLELYYHNGSEWKLAKNQTGVGMSGPFQDTSGPVTQFYFELAGVSKSYEYYAIFSSAPPPVPPGAVPTPTPGLTEPMQSTRAFSPDGVSPCGSPSAPSLTCARIFYMTLPAIANPSKIATNARIYNLRGDLVRILETQTDIDVAMNYDTNYDPTVRQYFLDWDGLNEQGILVKNGVYLVAVEWEWTNPMTFEVIRGTKSIPVAVVR